MLMLIAASCSLERKLAYEFVGRKDSVSVLLIPPDYLFKTNLKNWKIENPDQLSQEALQRSLIDSSLFLKDIENEQFIEDFMVALENSLQQHGFKVYPPSRIPEFFEKKRDAYQVAVVQMELEETVYPYRAEATFDDSLLYYEDFLLEMVTLNTWFEISKLNDTIGTHNTLFTSDYVMDGLEGRFASNVFTGKVTYRYNYNPIQLKNIYTLSTMLGQRYADYTFDFLMNRHVFLSMPPGRQSTTYFRYDQTTQKISPAGENRFIFMEE
jgi:hypothetical protein